MVKVGASFSLSGRFATQGVQARRGFMLWAEDTNAGGGLLVTERGGREPVETSVYDDESKKGAATALAERLIAEDRVDLLVGPYSSVLALAAARVAEDHRKVLFNHGGSSDAISGGRFGYVVNVPSPASRYLVPVLEMVTTIAPSAYRLALLHGRRGTFPRAVMSGAEAYAQRNGLRVALKAAYPSEPADFASLVRRLAALKPDVILGAGRTEDDLRLAHHLAGRRGLARAVGLVVAPIEAFGHGLGDAAEGFFGPSQWEPKIGRQPGIGPTSEEFVFRFRNRFGAQPDYPAAQSYAAGLIAQKCVEKAGTLRDEPLREAADGLSVSTFYGGFDLDGQTGEQTGHEPVVVQWQGGRRRVVWPPQMAEAPARILEG